MVLKYTDDEAAAIEVSYSGHDVVAQRSHTLQRLSIQPGEEILDVGAGPGFLAREMADATGSTGRVVGVDMSEAMVRRATERNDCAWVSYIQGDATELPVDDAGFDIVVSTQVAEYMADLTPYAAEIARVLRPGGRALILTTDWDSVVWHSADPARMARVIKGWNTTLAQTNVPRILAPHLQAAGLEVTGASCFPIVNLDRREGSYSAGNVEFITDYVAEQGLMSADELAEWAAEQEALERAGAYFFAIGRYIFEARKPG